MGRPHRLVIRLFNRRRAGCVALSRRLPLLSRLELRAWGGVMQRRRRHLNARLGHAPAPREGGRNCGDDEFTARDRPLRHSIARTCLNCVSRRSGRRMEWTRSVAAFDPTWTVGGGRTSREPRRRPSSKGENGVRIRLGIPLVDRRTTPAGRAGRRLLVQPAFGSRLRRWYHSLSWDGRRNQVEKNVYHQASVCLGLLEYHGRRGCFGCSTIVDHVRAARSLCLDRQRLDITRRARGSGV